MVQKKFKRSISLFVVLLMLISLIGFGSMNAIAVSDTIRGDLQPGTTVSGVIDASTYHHIYSFKLNSDGEVLFKLATVDGPNVGVYVYDKNKSTLYQDRQTVDTKLPLAAGTYYVDVYANIGSYTLSNTFTPQALANDTENNDTKANAVPMNINSQMTGHLGYRSLREYTDYEDTYKIVLPSDGKLSLNVVGDPTLGPKISLFGEKDVWYGYGKEDPFELKAGTYYVIVFSAGYGGYTLTNKFVSDSGTPPGVTPPPTGTPTTTGTMPPTGTAPSFWNPYQRRTVRDGSGNWQTTIAPGANAWWASGGALSFQGTGNNTYIEDFVQSGTPYRVEGIQISFELQATVATTQGYVGPYVLLTNAGAGWQDPAGIGAQVFYNWESRGTRGGFLQRGGGGVDRKDLVVPGVNDGRFARHTITVVNGVVTWSADGKVLISGPLAHAAPSQLYLIVGTRMYDAGVAQSIRIRNLTVTEASPK